MSYIELAIAERCLDLQESVVLGSKVIQLSIVM